MISPLCKGVGKKESYVKVGISLFLPSLPPLLFDILGHVPVVRCAPTNVKK